MSDRVYGVSKVTGDSRLQSDVLEDLSDARRYRRWLADLARPYLGDNPIEIGSGTGDYALEWVPGVTTFTATEADEARYRRWPSRFDGHDRDPGQLPPARRRRRRRRGAEHSAAVAFNVFEHIPDHVAALRAAASWSGPGGAVVLIVPAFPSAMSRFDRAIGHQRRYTMASLRAAFDRAGLAAEHGPLPQPDRAAQLVHHGQGAGRDPAQRGRPAAVRPRRRAAGAGAGPAVRSRSGSPCSRVARVVRA